MNKKDNLSPEDILAIQEVWEKLKGIDLEKAAEERLAKLTPVERMIEALNEKHGDMRKLRKDLNKKKRATHWRTKRKRKRAKENRYYHSTLKAKRSLERAEQLKTPEGWWKHLNKVSWKPMKAKVTMTYEEFLEHFYEPYIGKGRLVIFYRYDKQGPISLGNVLVRDNENREVLFDGKEYLLQQAGYVLPPEGA